jgi:hypothetical protein
MQNRLRRRAPYSTTHMIQPRLRKPEQSRGKASSSQQMRTQANSVPQQRHAACGLGGEMAAYTQAEEQFHMCVHARRDVISDRIRSRGMWDDCEDIVWLVWTHFGTHRSTARTRKKPKGYVSWMLGTRQEDSHATGQMFHVGHDEANVVKEKIPLGLVVVDVGANIGEL